MSLIAVSCIAFPVSAQTDTSETEISVSIQAPEEGFDIDIPIEENDTLAEPESQTEEISSQEDLGDEGEVAGASEIREQDFDPALFYSVLSLVAGLGTYTVFQVAKQQMIQK